MGCSAASSKKCSIVVGRVPGSSRFVSIVRSQSQDEISALLTGGLEPALLEHPDRGNVVFGDVGVEGTSLFEVQKHCERLRGDAHTPVLLADPVADFPFTGVHEAHDVAG